MKKVTVNQYISRLIFISAALVVAACSAKEDPVVPPVYPTEGVSFSISAEQWGESPLTRAEGGDTATDTVVSLCDEVSASISCITDLPDPTTKASTSVAPNGDYTIVAKQSGKETVINVNWNGTAIIDKRTGKAARMDLVPGACNFLCFNDKLERSGGQLVITSANDYANALSGTCEATIVEGTQSVQFTLKHHFARLKVSIVGVGLNETTKDVVYEKQGDGSALRREISYANTAGYTARLNTISEDLIFTGFKSVSIPEAGMPSWLKSYQKIESQYVYLADGQTLPGTLSFLAPDASTGKNMVYGISMQGTSFALNGAGTTCHSNDSYTLRVFVSYNFKYLFSDGTVGTLAANWKSKTPVALVCRSNPGMAVALKDANNGAKCVWTTKTGNTQRNIFTPTYGQGETMIQDNSGYLYTWNTDYTLDVDSGGKKRLRATDPEYPPFIAATNYDPGVPGWTYANGGKQWYLPSCSDFKVLYENPGSGSFYTLHTSNPGFHEDMGVDINATYSWRGVLLVKIAMEQAGGDNLYNHQYHTATQAKSSATYYYTKQTPVYLTMNRTAIGASSQCYVRAFINF